MDELYDEIIMEHGMNSYNKKKLEECDFCEKGHNPNCGDDITIEVKLDGNVISKTLLSQDTYRALEKVVVKNPETN